MAAVPESPRSFLRPSLATDRWNAWLERVRRWRRREAIPLPDARLLRAALRRTTLVRLALGGLLVIFAALAVWRATDLSPRPVSYLPAQSTTIVVLDQSKSIFVLPYHRIAKVLRQLVSADVRVGLVAFSDTAYELLPPGARGSDLEPLLRFYLPAQGGTNVDPTTNFLSSPWDNVFSGGTRISQGISLAQSILHRDHVRNGTILLLSDLGAASADQTVLAQTLVDVERDRAVNFRVVPLYPIRADKAFVARFVPQSQFLEPSDLKGSEAIGPRRTLVGRTPWPLLVVGGLLLLALAANEFFCGRLQLPRTREEVA